MGAGLRFVSGLPTETRLAATAFLFLLAVVLSRWGIPAAVHAVKRVSARVFEEEAPETVAEAFRESLSWAVAVELFVAGLQALVAVATVFAVLTVWGRTDVVITLLGFIELVLPTVWRVVVSTLLIVGAYLSTDALDELVDTFSEGRSAITEHQTVLLKRVTEVTLFVVVGLTALSIWRVDLGGLLVGAGFLGIVVGLAARQTLGALIAGFVLMFARPFEVGDWVEIADQEGIVVGISIMNTRIRTFSGEDVMIPNDRVSDSVVVNNSREGQLRLEVEVGVDYEDDSERAEELALDAIKSVDAVASAPPPQVFATGFGDSAVVLELRFWIDTPIPGRKWAAIRGVVHAVKEAYDREGISIPFPQRTLDVREGVEGESVSFGSTALRKRE